MKRVCSHRYLALILVLCLVTQIFPIGRVYAAETGEEKITVSFDSVLEDNREIITISAKPRFEDVDITGIRLPDGSLEESNQASYAANKNGNYKFEVYYKESVLDEKQENKLHNNKSVEDAALSAEKKPDADRATGSEAQTDKKIPPNGEIPTDDKIKPDGGKTTDDKVKPDGGTQTDDKVKPDGGTQTDDKVKPDGGTQTDDKVKPDGETQTDDKIKPDGGTPTDDKVKPDGGTPTDDKIKPDGETQTDDKIKPDGGSQTDNKIKPDGETQTDDKIKPDGGKTADDKIKPDGGTPTDDKVKPDRGTQTDDKIKPDGGTQSDDKIKPDGGTQTDDKIKPDGGTQSDDKIKPDGEKQTDDKVKQPDEKTQPKKEKPSGEEIQSSIKSELSGASQADDKSQTGSTVSIEPMVKSAPRFIPFLLQAYAAEDETGKSDPSDSVLVTEGSETYTFAASKIGDEDGSFIFNGDTQTIVGYNPNASKDVVIPPKIGGVDVLHIGSDAFEGQQLTGIVIPEGVKTIGIRAFSSNPAITSIVLPDSLERIGYSAFSNCSGLKTINIPTHVTEIESTMFSGCSSLEDVQIPNNITAIKECAFEKCTSLTSIVIPSSVTSIGNWTFAECSNLASISIPEQVTHIGNRAFFKCEKLKSIVIPAGITRISDSEFQYCSSLTSITIPESITSIGDYAFWGCGSLGEITIPKNVTSIGIGAFTNCFGIKNIEIPESVDSIGIEAFAGCNSLTGIHIPEKNSGSIEGAPWGAWRETIIYWKGTVDIKPWTFDTTTKTIVKYSGNETSVTIPETLTSNGSTYPVEAFLSSTFGRDNKIEQLKISDKIRNIPERAFSNCGWLTSITIPDNVVSIGDDAFSGCSNLISIDIPTKNKGDIPGEPWGGNKDIIVSWKDTLKTDQWIFDPSTNTIEKYLGKETSVIIPETLKINDTVYPVKNISSVPFGNNSKITSLNILAKISKIPDEAFLGYTSLSEVMLPDSITDIGEGAFRQCYSLNSIKIPNSVIKIGEEAFYGCTYLTDIEIPGSVTSIERGAFGSCENLKKIKIPASVTSMGNAVFVGCEGLTSVELPDSLSILGDDVFRGCSSLTEIKIPDSITGISKMTFSGCSSLKKIVIPDSVTVIAYAAFEHCTSLTEIKLPEKLSVIDWGLFSDCSSLTEISLPDHIEFIGSQAFEGCSSLTKIVIPDSVKNIGGQVFEGCSSLMKMEIPGSVNTIGEAAFRNTPKLEGIHIMKVDSPGLHIFGSPWGANNSVKVKYLGEFVSFEHTEDMFPGEYARNIHIRASVDKGWINWIMLPDDKDTTRRVGAAKTSFDYKVTSNGTYLFKGEDGTGEVVEYEVTINSIGQPTVTAANGVIQASDAPALGEQDILNLVKAKATTKEFGDDSAVKLSIRPSDVEAVRGLTAAGASAEVTVEAKSTTGLTDSVTVTVKAVEHKVDPVTHTVTFNTNGGMPVPQPQTIAEGSKVERPEDPGKTGYKFEGWYRNASLETPWDFGTDLVGSDAVTLYAGYTVNKYTVIFADWNGTQIGEDQKVEYGHGAVAPAPPSRSGYTFTGWNHPFDSITGDLTVRAQYRLNSSGSGGHSGGGGHGGGSSVTVIRSFTLSYETNGGSGISSELVEEGTLSRLNKETRREGFTFEGWYAEAGLKNEISSVYMDGNKTVYAKWIQGEVIPPVSPSKIPAEPILPPVKPSLPLAGPRRSHAVPENPGANLSAVRAKEDLGITITPETSTVLPQGLEISPESQGKNPTVDKPEFGMKKEHKSCILQWILWLLTILLAIYTLYKRKKNKRELEKLIKQIKE